MKKLATAQKIGTKFEKLKSAVLFPSKFISPFPSLSVSSNRNLTILSDLIITHPSPSAAQRFTLFAIQLLSTMSSETLENERPQAKEEVQDEENHTKQEDTSMKKDVSENGNVKEETDEPGEAKSSKSAEESDYTTPTSKRPTRERKTVDRYTASSTDKFHKASSLKASTIEKVHTAVYGLLIFMFYF